MFSISHSKKYLRPKTISLVLLAVMVGAGLIVYAKTRVSEGPYSLAADLPRGALVYAQFKDLPGLLKRWDESALKQQYLGSANYSQFQHRHLALKLVQRWSEFNDGLGFQLDSASIGEAAESGAALAIYDIGKLDLVFIAPLSEEKLAATRFFKSKSSFEETTLADGTSYYRHEVEASSGHQKQVLAFATIKGRFVLATNERLLLRTIANINGKAVKDTLADDPAFTTLSATFTPHFLTVWVDQTKLNDDYYFKQYWLMRNVTQLKGIRAGIFDVEFQDGRWTERRDFLTTAKAVRATNTLSAAEAQRLRALLPEGVPYVKVQSLNNDPQLVTTLLRDTLLDKRLSGSGQTKHLWSWQSYDDDGFYVAERDEESSQRSYTYLNGDYDSSIVDPRDARLTGKEEPGANPLGNEIDSQFLTSLQTAVGPASPQAALVATRPQTTSGPLFVEFRRVAIVTLQTPGNLKRDVLEEAISRVVQGRVTVAGPTVELKWVSHDEAARPWRELEMPLLGWKLCYAQLDSELILANSPELLKTVLENQGKQPGSKAPAAASLDDLTVVRFDQRKEAFDDILGRLDAEEAKRQKARAPKDSASPAPQFFAGEVGSLLNVAANVSRVEIRRSSSAGRLHEEIDYLLKN